MKILLIFTYFDPSSSNTSIRWTLPYMINKDITCLRSKKTPRYSLRLLDTYAAKTHEN